MSKRSQFHLFQSHLDLAHAHWAQLLKPGDHVIDATCGNGHDTLKLAELVLDQDKGAVFALDIQETAIALCRIRLAEALSQEHLKRVHFYCTCHTSFPQEIAPATIKLIVYNLGYLPGGDKGLTTLSDQTLRSLEAAQRLLLPGGAISITCYPGHAQGKEEQETLLAFAATLDPREWSACHHRWLNRKDAPSLLLLQKAYHPVSKTAP